MSDSIREALTKAYSDAEKTPDSAEVATEATDAPVAASTPDPEGSAPSGETSKPGDDSAPADATPGQGTPPQAATPPVADTDPAPASWKAEEKAAWAQVPKAAREAFKRREAEMQRGLSAAAEGRKAYAPIEAEFKRFEPLLKQNGITDPVNQLLIPLMHTRAALEIGTPEQKAHLIANLIGTFKVPVETLDRFLVQGVPNVPQAPAQVNYRNVPELAPLFAIAEQVQRHQQTQAAQQVSQVASLPHFEMVREDMADILENYAKAGKDISLEQAYKRAVAMNPELEPATTAPQVSTSEAAAILARSRNAASSVAGAPKQGATAQPTDLRSQLENAWANHGRV